MKPGQIVPESTCISTEITDWKRDEAVNLGNLNCLRVNTSIDIPHRSHSHSHQIDAHAFHECDIIKPNGNESNLTLHLKMETLNLKTDFPEDVEFTLGT